MRKRFRLRLAAPVLALFALHGCSSGSAESDAGPAMVDAAMSVTDAAGPRVVDLPGGLRLLRVQGRLQVAR